MNVTELPKFLMYSNANKFLLKHEIKFLYFIKDAQWTDIDTMSDHKDWTFDKINFPNLPSIVENLHDHDQFYINIIDPAISNTKGYDVFDEGVDMNVFIKMFNSSELLVGSVWPGSTVFPDFTNPNTSKWWTKMAAKYYKDVKFDGLWIVCTF